MKIGGMLALVAGGAVVVSGWVFVAPAEEPAKNGSNSSSRPSTPSTIVTGTRQKRNPAPAIPKPTVVLKPGESPKAKFDSIEHRFGTVLAGTDVNHTFKFKNVGTGPLEILAVKPGCGCTTSGEYERIIQPGAEGSIPIKMSTTKFQGPVNKSVTVHTNGSGVDNLIMLTVSGDVKPLYLVEPGKLEFGSLKLAEVAGKGLSKTVRITNKIDKPLELSNVRSSNANYTVKTNVLEPGQVYELTVTLSGNVRTGSNGTSIEAETNFPEASSIRIPAAIYVNAPLDIMPSQLTLSKSRKLPMSRALFIRNNTAEPATVSDLKVSSPKLTARLEETTPGMAWKVTLDVPADYQSPELGDTLSLNTSNAEIPELVVDIITREWTPPGATTKPTEKPQVDEHAGHNH